jgi:hypothetical protein
VKNVKRKFMRIPMFMISLMAMIIVASAVSVVWANLNISPNKLEVNVGAYGYYTLTLDSDRDINALNWNTNSDSVVASIDGGSGYPADLKDGTVDINYLANSGKKEYKLRVMPISGSVIGSEYGITVSTPYDEAGLARAKVTGSLAPVPEVPTGVLMSAGLIGLICLIRFQRKK